MSLLLGINLVDDQVAGQPQPAPMALVEPVPAPLSPSPPQPARLPYREGPRLLQLTPPPRREPDPSPQSLVELTPVPLEEPTPATMRGLGGDLARAERVLTRLGLLALRPEDPQLVPLHRVHPAARSTAGTVPQRQHFEEPREPLKPGTCGGLAGAGFAVRGHLFTASWIERTLHGVIANHCQSKHYDDITSLDGGTVGISHFASGSLDTLYHLMDQRRYFGAHAGHVPARPYRLGWWREGMSRFMRSPEARSVQFRAWRAYISPSLAAALGHGWSTDRELAIAASVANSLGSGGFQHIALQNHWEPERTLRSYARRTAHKERRRVRLNREFPTVGPPGERGDHEPALASAHAQRDSAQAD